jgi:hypothetical protein
MSLGAGRALGRLSSSLGATTPKEYKATESLYANRKARLQFRRRGSIECAHRPFQKRPPLGPNFPKGQQGDALTMLLADAASNLSLRMRKVLSAYLSVVQN